MSVLGLDGMARVPAPEGWPTCRKCGCWEYGACWDAINGACWWVEEDLCSRCAGLEGGIVVVADLVGATEGR